MLRDASHHHTIQKFSFIESISSSRAQNHHSQGNFIEQNTEAFKIQQENQTTLAAQTEKNTPQTGALATTDDTVTINTNWYQPEQDYSLNLAKILYATTDTLEPQTNSQFSSPNKNWGKILFALACSYCIFVIWWVFGHQGNNLWVNLTGGKNVVLSKSDVEFIDYLERSLNKIDRKIAANKKSSEEVVYVPVYTPSAPERVASNVSSVPLSSLPITSTNIPTPPAPLPIPAPPPLPAPTPIATPAPDKEVASKPQISHALIGVLELGEGRSAALVKVQGKTRRIWVGEEIHADGWILESIGNQRANISKGEQVRSISVGETF